MAKRRSTSRLPEAASPPCSKRRPALCLKRPCQEKAHVKQAPSWIFLLPARKFATLRLCTGGAMNRIGRHTADLLFSAACAFFLSANLARAADAPDCKPLQLLNSIKMTTNADRSRFYVPVTINGAPKNFLLD